MMTDRSYDNGIPYTSELMTDGLKIDDPPLKLWRLKSENYRAARRALYAARAQLA